MGPGPGVGKETGRRGLGADALPQPQRHTHNCKDPVSVAAPRAAFLWVCLWPPWPPSRESLPSWECQSARRRNLRTTMQPKDQLRLEAQALLPPHPPWGVKALVSRRSGAQGLPQSTGKASSGTQRRTLARGWRGGKMDRRSLTGMDGAGCSAGRFSIHSAMASFRSGASAQPPGEALAELEGRWGRRQSRLFPLASEPSQTGPEGRADLPSAPGNQQRTPRQAEGVGPLRAVSADPAGPEAFSSRLWGRTPLREIQPTLARPAKLMLLSPETSPCLSVLGSLGTGHSSGHQGSSIPRCPSCSPTSYRHLGPWPRCGLEGSGRRARPLMHRGSSAGEDFLQWMGASRAHDKYQQREGHPPALS